MYWFVYYICIIPFSIRGREDSIPGQTLHLQEWWGGGEAGEPNRGWICSGETLQKVR